MFHFEKKIYQFETFGDYLSAWLLAKKETQKGYSFKVMAKSLKCLSASSLGMISRNQRFPKKSAGIIVFDYLGLSVAEVKFAELLLDRSKERSADAKIKITEKLHRMRPVRYKSLDSPSSEFFEHWVTPAIFEIATQKPILEDAEWIQGLFQWQVSKRQINQSLKLLKNLYYLKYDHQGNLRASEDGLTIDTPLTSQSLRKLHNQYLALAMQAVEKVPVSDRHLMTQTICVDREKLSLARERMAAFFDEFHADFKTPPKISRNKVYQFQLAFFPIAKTP